MYKKWYAVLAESYIVIMVLAMAIGLFVPQAKHLIPWTTLILQLIFFISSLKMRTDLVWASAKDWKFLLAVNIYMMVLLPIAVWALVWPMPTGLGMALFLLAAMPSGMTTPLLVEVAGGKQAAAMVMVVTTSLLAPLTVPILTKVLYGASVTIDIWGMFLKLAMVIFLPFLLAILCRHLFTETVKKINLKTKPISIYLLGVLIIATISAQSENLFLLSADWWKLIILIIGLYVFVVLMHLAGYFGFWWKSHAEKNTASISLTYMNFVLAIYIAGEFFPSHEILLPLVLIILPWATFLPVWQQISAKLAQNPQKSKKKKR